MAPKDFDGVIEAVRYTPAGMVDLVRFYERRGPTYSDRLIISRSELVNRLKAGKRFALGMRKPLLASTFQVIASVRLVKSGNQEVLVTSRLAGDQDKLDQAPIF